MAHDVSRSKEAIELAKRLYPDRARNLANDDLFMRETSPPGVTTDNPHLSYSCFD
jgi:hypothetical protein